MACRSELLTVVPSFSVSPPPVMPSELSLLLPILERIACALESHLSPAVGSVALPSPAAAVVYRDVFDAELEVFRLGIVESMQSARALSTR